MTRNEENFVTPGILKDLLEGKLAPKSEALVWELLEKQRGREKRERDLQENLLEMERAVEDYLNWKDDNPDPSPDEDDAKKEELGLVKIEEDEDVS